MDCRSRAPLYQTLVLSSCDFTTFSSGFFVVFEVITESIYSAPSARKGERKVPYLHHSQPEMYSRRQADSGWGHCSIRQVIWFSVLKACEFLDHQSYLHSNISIQTHLSPNIVQPFYEVGVGRQDLCRLWTRYVCCWVRGFELKYHNISVNKEMYSRDRLLFYFVLFFCFFSFLPFFLVAVFSSFFFSFSSLSSHLLFLLLVGNFVS